MEENNLSYELSQNQASHTPGKTQELTKQVESAFVDYFFAKIGPSEASESMRNAVTNEL